MSAGPRAPKVLLLELSERTSATGGRWCSGFLGKARVVAFPGEADKWGNPTIAVYVQTPEPRPEQRPQDPDPGVAASARAPAKPSASPAAHGDGWRGPSSYRRADGDKRAPAADGGALPEDTLEDLYR